MEILLWLAPAALVTLAAMAWVGWQGRGHRELDRETVARRIGEALARQEGRRHGYAAPRRTPDPATGVKVRRHETQPDDSSRQQAS
ncbi:hypothetical protein KUV85_08565 [Nocardioides panacisoli]|uniref:hypothetical protein n=1 Tax=Nocardioides panacisoli TaxID=627624 RepID=UPI001C6393FA|nr:hypothetical protein [Nocardioides panacisoli]QYJ05715.1 hypothetical protein KUV85_08565 [Nocardioides panacisoli]